MDANTGGLEMFASFESLYGVFDLLDSENIGRFEVKMSLEKTLPFDFRELGL
jgi:hypothetical protein